ncbi:hypothetical protein B0H12DRAFT_1077031 [Mycena haematopus]|nr:hypothetical protein B0H12DRAFT_1077031 [Mycena haematopus]
MYRMLRAQPVRASQELWIDAELSGICLVHDQGFQGGLGVGEEASVPEMSIAGCVHGSRTGVKGTRKRKTCGGAPRIASIFPARQNETTASQLKHHSCIILRSTALPLQVDVWRFSDSSDLTHIATLDVYVKKSWGPSPFIDRACGLLILPEPIQLYARLADVDIQYRETDGHALVLLVEDARSSQPHGKTSMRWPRRQRSQCVSLPPHLEEREKLRDLTPLVLEPIWFGKTGDIIATSTTRWLGKVDLLLWHGGSSAEDRQFTKTLELLPGLEGCKSMLAPRHIALDDSTLVLCTHEDAGPGITERTFVRTLDTSTLTVKWTAKPIPGQDRESLQIRTALVILDARTGDRRAIHAVDSDAQGSYVVDCFVSRGDDPIVGLAWQNGDILTVGLNKEGRGREARTLGLFPAELIAASVGRKEIVAVAGVKKHPVISEGGREEDIPDWEEEEGKVMFAKW